MLKDGFSLIKLTKENISTTEKEGMKYAYSNRVFTSKINPREFVQSKISSPLAVAVEKTSSLCPGFFFPKF